MFRHTVFPFLCLALVSAAPVRAELLYYEPFAYPAGDDGLTGNGGFGGGDSAGAEADIREGSLGYTDADGRVLTTQGNHCLVDAGAEGASVSQFASLSLIGALGDTLWFSLVGQQTAGENARFFNVGFYAPDNTVSPPDSNSKDDEIFVIGMPSGQEPPNRWRVVDRALGVGWSSAISGTDSFEQVFAVVRVRLNVDGFNERYTLWVNPALDHEPDDATGFSFTSSATDLSGWADITAIRIAAGGTSGAGPASDWIVDEIRVGDTFADVAPWTGSAGAPEFAISQVTRAQDGRLTISWPLAPGFVDVVQESADLATWKDVAGAFFGPGVDTVTWTSPVPAPGNTARWYRLRRSPVPIILN